MHKLIFMTAVWCIETSRRLTVGRVDLNWQLFPKPGRSWFDPKPGLPHITRYLVGCSGLLLERAGLRLGRLIGRERNGYLLGGIHGH